jgi:raffinose/stachyose/melibiose transport system permease protein
MIIRAGLFMAPALILYVLFAVYPLISSLLGSVFSWQGFVRGDFVALDNFTRLFGGTEWPRVSGAFLHNVFWFLGILVVQNGLGLILAWALYRRRGRTEGIRALIFLPAILSPVLVGALWRLLLAPNGALNELLLAMGVIGSPIAWIGDGSTALWALILVDAWNWLGLPLLVFYAGFQAIPAELIEAGELDGAGRLRLLSAIALPLVVPSILILTVLTFINTFNQFDIVYVMTGPSGSPSFTTDVLGTYFYRLAFGAQGASGLTDIGLALALASCMFALLAVGSAVGLRILGSRIVRY